MTKRHLVLKGISYQSLCVRGGVNLLECSLSFHWWKPPKWSKKVELIITTHPKLIFIHSIKSLNQLKFNQNPQYDN